MLQVKTYVSHSTIPNAGNGLFAGEDIPKGTIIWQLNPRIDKIIQINDWIHINAIERAYLEKYAYRDGDCLILCSDDGKYINHSTEPNVDDIISPEHGSISITNRDIKMGEEFLSDYSAFDDDSRNINLKF